MRHLGFQCHTRKKRFYVDGHKRDEADANRYTFWKQNITHYKRYCNCWMQQSVDEA